MAISAPHFAILKHCKAAGILPQGSHILEIGEANYYGDFDPREVFEMAGEECNPQDLYAVAKLIYKAFFAPSCVQAIDAGGPTALKADLNRPQEDWGFFTSVNSSMVVYNHGTAEHVFNIAQVFRTMHQCCNVGGIMIHESPFTGWIDHGFYCLQPTLFWDVAQANDYKIELFAIESITPPGWGLFNNRADLLQLLDTGELPKNLMLFVIMRKQTNDEFKIPMQGIYAGTAGQEAVRAWKAMR